MGSENVFKKLIDFVDKDTAERNESRRVTVIIRVIVISFILYFTFDVLLSNSFGNIWIFCLYGLFLGIYVGIFAASYRCRTITVLRLFNTATIVWIVSIIHLFGWDIGVQHFLMVLMVLYFFADYKKYVRKGIFAVFLCALRIYLFYRYHAGASVWQLASWQENLLQITSTVIIFWCLAIISLICSRNNQELERKLVEYNNQLKEEAGTDTLTGLFNRRKAVSCLEDIVRGGEFEKGLSLCICDIDFFKRVNDNYGHDFGDEVLVAIARIFKEIPERSIAARWGGEEFLLVFPDCNGDDAYLILERLREKIKNTVVNKEDIQVSVTMTFGLTEYDFMNGLEATIKDADKKLYMGKNSGRDKIVF